jgi:hypothetical protein
MREPIQEVDLEQQEESDRRSRSNQGARMSRRRHSPREQALPIGSVDSERSRSGDPDR